MKVERLRVGKISAMASGSAPEHREMTRPNEACHAAITAKDGAVTKSRATGYGMTMNATQQVSRSGRRPTRSDRRPMNGIEHSSTTSPIELDQSDCAPVSPA